MNLFQKRLNIDKLSSVKPFCTCKRPSPWFLPALFGPSGEVRFCALVEHVLGGTDLVRGPPDLEKYCFRKVFLIAREPPLSLRLGSGFSGQHPRDAA